MDDFGSIFNEGTSHATRIKRYGQDPIIRNNPEAHDIVTALERRREDDSDLHFNSTIKYLLDRDKHYEGTKWEMHLFDVFAELEQFYDSRQRSRKSETLNSIDDWRNWEYN